MDSERVGGRQRWRGAVRWPVARSPIGVLAVLDPADGTRGTRAVVISHRTFMRDSP